MGKKVFNIQVYTLNGFCLSTFPLLISYKNVDSGLGTDGLSLRTHNRDFNVLKNLQKQMPEEMHPDLYFT